MLPKRICSASRLVKKPRGARLARTLGIALLGACATAAQAHDPMPPFNSLYGAYAVVGKSPGADGHVYGGWVRLAVEDDFLSVDRCENGVHTTGTGHQKFMPGGERLSIEFAYTRNGADLSATCLAMADADNLPRFSCYTYPTEAANITVPGVESLYPIVWPVPLDFFDCR